ncbi:hypothetical protein JCM5296_003137, partial [Sporobolomyces johnsonii]
DLKDCVRPELTEAEKAIVGDSFQTELSKLHDNTVNKTTGEPVSKSSLQAAEKKRAVYVSKVLDGNKDWMQQEPDDVELCMRLAERDVPEFAYCVASNGGGAKGEGAWKSRRFVKLGFEGLIRKKRVRGKKAAQAGPATGDADMKPVVGKGKARATEVGSASEVGDDDEAMYEEDEDNDDEPLVKKSLFAPGKASSSSASTSRTISHASPLAALPNPPTRPAPIPISSSASGPSTSSRAPAFAMPARGDYALNSSKAEKKAAEVGAAGVKRAASEAKEKDRIKQRKLDAEVAAMQKVEKAAVDDDDDDTQLDLAKLAPFKSATKRTHVALKKTELAELCKAVNKPFTGKKEILQDRVLVAIVQYQDRIPEPVDEDPPDLSLSSSRRATTADDDGTASEVDAPGEAIDE